MSSPSLVIDFDSTFVSCESLDQLARIVLQDNPDRDRIVSEIEAITRQGMEGKITFEESLSKRVALFTPSRYHIHTLIDYLQTCVTSSFVRHKKFFHTYADSIYIVSGGFIDCIAPVVESFGIHRNHICANAFIYNEQGDVTGYDDTIPVAHKGGKAKAVKAFKLSQPVWVIGDGYTDYEIKQAGVADRFIAYVEHVKRDAVVANADVVASSFDEVVKKINAIVSFRRIGGIGNANIAFEHIRKLEDNLSLCKNKITLDSNTDFYCWLNLYSNFIITRLENFYQKIDENIYQNKQLGSICEDTIKRIKEIDKHFESDKLKAIFEIRSSFCHFGMPNLIRIRYEKESGGGTKNIVEKCIEDWSYAKKILDELKDHIDTMYHEDIKREEHGIFAIGQ